MKHKLTILGIFGIIIGAICYYYYTIMKVWNIDGGSLDEDFDDDSIFDEDTAKAFDTEDLFDDIDTEDIFKTDSESSILGNTKVNILDDNSDSDLVCNISREDAIDLISKERDNYSKAQLTAMSNIELASLYSDIINN